MDSVRGDDSPARGARMSPARLGATYIFSGLAKTGANGRLEPSAGTKSGFVPRDIVVDHRLDQILEGRPAVLVRDGHICKSELAKELITVHELQTVCRRQGFEGIHEVEHCILEPGGAFVMKRKVPSEQEQKHEQLMNGLQDLKAQLDRLEAKLA